MSTVWINGSEFDEADASLRYDDHGITVGDGAFETIKLANGEPFALTRHLRRLARSLHALRLPSVDLDEMRAAVLSVGNGHGGNGFIRVTVTAGPGPLGSPRDLDRLTKMVAVRAGTLQEEPTGVITAPFTRNERGALTGVKSTSYAENVVALDLARAADCGEALLPNTVGNLCEGTGSNVFVVIEDQLVTPPLASGCLAGITRELLSEVLDDVIERDVSMDEIGQVTEAFLTSTAREVQPIRSWDGRSLAGCPGPHTVRARAAWLGAFGPGRPIDP